MLNRHVLRLGFIFLLCITLQLPLKEATFDGVSVGNESETMAGGSFRASYVSSSPIIIYNNSDFAYQASGNSWPGNGSYSSPYIIARLNVTLGSSTGVLFEVRDTDVYFRFCDSLLVGGAVAISLLNVIHGTIVNNSIHDANEQGMLLTGCNQTEVVNNTVTDTLAGPGLYIMQCNIVLAANNTLADNADRGILIDYSSLCTISRNTILHSGYNGITLRDSNRNLVCHNEVYNSTSIGIVLGHAMNNTLVENDVRNSSYGGISLEASEFTNITHNLVYRSIDYGLSIVDSDFAVVTNNTFYANGLHGLRLLSDQANVAENNFIDNSFGVATKEAYDNGANSEFARNFWSTWLFPDSDHDQVVDSPYLLNGDAANVDHYPRTVVYPTEQMHILVRPLIIFPDTSVNDTTLYDMVNVTWALSSDTFGHDISYSVYYSRDLGQNWTELATALVATHYSWNLSDIPENTTCILKVVAECSEGLMSEKLSISIFSVGKSTTTTTTTTTVSTDGLFREILIGAGVLVAACVVGVVILFLRKR